MAQRGIKISELPADGELTGEEVVPLAEGTTKSCTTQQIADLASSGGPVAASDVTVSPSVLGQSDAQSALQALEAAIPSDDPQNLAETLAEGNTTGVDGHVFFTEGSAAYFSTPGQNQFQSSIVGSANALVTNYNPYASSEGMRPVIFQQEVAASGTTSHVYGATANNTFGETEFWIVVLDTILETTYVCKYLMVKSAGPAPPGGYFRDLLVPIVAPDDHSPALAITVELSGPDNARQIDITNDTVGPLTISLYRRDSGGILLPVAP